jgi:predicted nucleic acid-binding protein
MALILFDTNIFIDMPDGCARASKELNSYEEPAINVITYMELYSGAVARPNEVVRLKALPH